MSSTSSSHILGRDGAPAPKQPQSSVRPRNSADAKAVKNITESKMIASAPMRLVRRPNSKRPHAISNGGRPIASRLDEHRRQDPECGNAIRELQRIADLVDGRVDESPSHRQADRQHCIGVRPCRMASSFAFCQTPAGPRPTTPPIRR